MSVANRVLAAALVLQLVAVVAVFWPSSDAPGAGQVFPGLEAGSIVAITMSNLEGFEVRVENRGDGCVLPRADDFPCRGGKMLDLAEKIAGLTTGRLVTETASSHRQLRVSDQDFERLVEIELSNGGIHKLYVGSSPRFGSAHVRASDQDKVYLVSTMSGNDAPVDPGNWVDTMYFWADSDEVVSVSVENENGRIDLERDPGGPWSLGQAGPEDVVDQAEAEAVANRASAIRMLAPLGNKEFDTYRLGDPAAVITVETRNSSGASEILVLRIGDPDDPNVGYVAKSSATPYFVVLADFEVRGVVEKAAGDLLEAPPTPAPQTGSGS